MTAQTRSSGFTLIELMVAITIMALLALLSWRGLDGMARAQAQTSQRADEVLTLQAGLAQWKVDLDSLTQTPNVNSLDWDGRVLRMTRRTTSGGDDLVVVGWTRRADEGGQWLRWQSPALHTSDAWVEAWSRASLWAQNASLEDRAREVLVTPLENWQIFYFRSDAWTNPLSSEGAQAMLPNPANAVNPVNPATAGTPGTPGTPAGPVTGMPPAAQAAVPEGLRLILTLPAGQAIAGQLTLDWVRPTLGGEKS